MLSRSLRSCQPVIRCRRFYAVRPEIPVLPPNQPPESKTAGDAIPPMLPPTIAPVDRSPGSASSKAAATVVKDDAIPFGTKPIILEDQPATPKRSHRLRNVLLASVLAGVVLFGGGVYGSLENDTVYEMFTEFVPYGEEAVLYVQEREFRRRYPQAHAHVSKAAPRSSSTNVYIPQSGVMPSIREDPPKHTEAKILQSGPQNSALASTNKATPGGSNDVTRTNSVPASTQAPAGGPANDGLDKTGKLPEAKPFSKSEPKFLISGSDTKGSSKEDTKSVSAGPSPSTPTGSSHVEQQQQATEQVKKVEPIPPPAPLLKTFDIPKPNHKSIEALQFALNGIIKAANEYGSAPFFRDSLENAKDEVLVMNKEIAEIQAQERLQSEKKLTAQAQELDRKQQQQVAEINSQLTRYEDDMSKRLEQEKDRLNQAYTERLEEEVKRLQAIGEQKLRNELIEQSIELQKRLSREVKSRVEEERGGRLGKLQDLQKSIAELKQLNVDSSSFIEDRVKLQQLEIALNALKSVLHENKPRPFLKELGAVKDIVGADELLKITIDSVNKESAESGVPSLGQLGDRFRSVAEEVRKAALLPEDAGVAGHATSWLMSKVMFRKRGMVAGSDVEAVLARAEAYLEANDLDSATREMNALTGWAHIISSDWLKMARRYLELQQAISLMESSAVLQALKSQ